VEPPSLGHRLIHGLIARWFERAEPRVCQAIDIVVGWPPALDLAIGFARAA
jgi:hypothetical protein